MFTDQLTSKCGLPSNCTKDRTECRLGISIRNRTTPVLLRTTPVQHRAQFRTAQPPPAFSCTAHSINNKKKDNYLVKKK